MKQPSRDKKMGVADKIMRADRAVLRGLADADKQLDVAREVMEQRRRALARLADADRS